MRNHKIVSTVAIALFAAPALAGTCATDLDGDGTTGFSDLTALLNGWGPCVGCPGDINGDNTVGFADLTELLNAWGPCPIDVFEYPVFENQFALEVGQQFVNGAAGITLPQATYNRIDRDMGLIIAARPEVAASAASPPHTWRWEPFTMLLVIDTDLPSDEFDATLAFYQGEITNEFFDGAIIEIDFPLGANPIAMIPILEAIASVESAEPNNYIQTSNLTPRWEPANVGGGALLWTVVVAWDQGGICNVDISPCECMTTYEFLIQGDGSLSLLGVDSIPSPFNINATCVGYPPSP